MQNLGEGGGWMLLELSVTLKNLNAHLSQSTPVCCVKWTLFAKQKWGCAPFYNLPVKYCTNGVILRNTKHVNLSWCVAQRSNTFCNATCCNCSGAYSLCTKVRAGGRRRKTSDVRLAYRVSWLITRGIFGGRGEALICLVCFLLQIL